jgi:hypothetical protein
MFVCLMVPNATISVISWWSVLLVEETGGYGENLRPVASNLQTLSHNYYSTKLTIIIYNVCYNYKSVQIPKMIA